LDETKFHNWWGAYFVLGYPVELVEEFVDALSLLEDPDANYFIALLENLRNCLAFEDNNVLMIFKILMGTLFPMNIRLGVPID
jgi:hypothetical protein